MEFKKKFIIVGNGNAVTYKGVFPYITNNQIWMGVSKGIGGKMSFYASDDYDNKHNYYNEDGRKLAQVNNACWFTNIEHSKRHLPLDLYKHYNSKDYPKYDNYDAIECSKTLDIPIGYDGVIGVPITFLDKFCQDQFEIVGCSYKFGDYCGAHINGKNWSPSVNNKNVYARIFIRHKKHT